MKALRLGASEQLAEAGNKVEGAVTKVSEEWTARWLRRFDLRTAS
jgi:hypothetical protein